MREATLDLPSSAAKESSSQVGRRLLALPAMLGNARLGHQSCVRNWSRLQAQSCARIRPCYMSQSDKWMSASAAGTSIADCDTLSQ